MVARKIRRAFDRIEANLNQIKFLTAFMRKSPEKAKEITAQIDDLCKDTLLINANLRYLIVES